jgi:hypothetical protein
LVVLALSRPERAEVSIAAERPSSGAATTPRPALPAAEPVPPPQPATSSAELAPVAPRALTTAGAATRSSPATLADELDSLKIAQQALSASDLPAALEALDRYDRVLKGQKLRAEATLLRIEALSRSGQRNAAAGLARRFAEQNPTSPLVDRARSFIEPEAGGRNND